ncbi:MAG: hypothetical protein HJJLKODD_02920 [Phycisphaerae bacterium]|nr:hypothetical protein [Phycisphaerae bacterium]
MLRIRRNLLWLSILLGGGSLAATLAFAGYLHSNYYRQRISQSVSTFLKLPVVLERIIPQEPGALTVEGVTVFLPEQREKIFQCRQAHWQKRSGEILPPQYMLELRDGYFQVLTDQWREPDYRQVLESGLAHDFDALQLRQVELKDIDLDVSRFDWKLRIADASGIVVLGQKGQPAQATLSSTTINGFNVTKPITLSSRFMPGQSLVIDEVRLWVPPIPIQHLQLEKITGQAVERGNFAGEIIYENGPRPRVRLNGVARDLQLGELTGFLQGGPYHGRVEHVTIDQASIIGGQLEQLVCSARLNDLQLADWTERLGGWLALSGCAELTIERGEWRNGRLVIAVISGEVVDVDLERLTTALGWGRAKGLLQCKLHNLTIRDEILVQADIDAWVEPTAAGETTIDKQLVQKLAESLLGLTLPELPFDELEYSQLGTRLEIRDQQLRLRGLYGDGQQTILAIRMLGREVPIIRESTTTYDLPDFMTLGRQQLEQYDFRTLWPGWPGATTQPIAIQP